MMFLRSTLSTMVLMTVLASATLASDLCPADKNEDGVVGAGDLTMLLAAWGTDEPSCDFDEDGIVECFDLEYLIGNWGACPTCLGDINEDGVVGTSDLTTVLSTVGNDCRMDLNEDGDVDQDDVDAFLCLFGTTSPLGDFDGNGFVTVSDLTPMLSAVGRDCRGDLNRDGTIDKLDVQLIQTLWGPC